MLQTQCCSSIIPSPTTVSSIDKKTPFISKNISPQHPPLLIRFHTSHRENLRYLKTLNIISSTTTNTNRFFSPQTVDQILTLVNFFKSKGFSDPNIQKLALSCPQLFSSNLSPIDIDPVFQFLSFELSASQDESLALILCCPDILFSNVVSCLRPTLAFLRELGLKKLNSPTTLNAHLLNTRVDKFVEKIKFLEGLGFSEEEVRSVCGRLPAIFGYSVENNLTPKVEYLVIEMQRSVDELKVFPQYFAFSLDKRIIPRHLHLQARGVYVPLQRMLLWSDSRFYAKWK